MCAAVSGCLRKDTTHTLYISPDAGLRWTIQESGVASDEQEPGARAAEEQAYIGLALIGAHPAAAALQALGPAGLVQTTVVRDQRPFHVITEAPYGRVDRALDRLFKEAGINASVTLEQQDDRHCLRVRFDFSRELQDRGSPAAMLLEDIERFRFVLTEGRVVAGGGFETVDRSTAALSRESLSAVEAALDRKGQIELVLWWTLSVEGL
jgi:hypothetical protein